MAKDVEWAFEIPIRDNLCICPDGVRIVDWNFACLGNAALDLGFMLPSLHAEGGPSPETILPNAGEVAARVAGFFAAHAGLPAEDPVLLRIREIQRVQLEAALAWTVRELDLPAPDGPWAEAAR
jgi:aminoglycoside phosphotransferase (APT) family kinase protein